MIPIASVVLAFLAAWGVWGWQQAVDGFLKPDSIGLIPLVLIALAMYIVNLFRAAADIHADQMTAIATIERESEDRISTLQRRIEELSNVADPLKITFEPGVPPFEERHTTIGGFEPEERTTQTFRVRVQNTSSSDVGNVCVRLSFDPERPRLSNLPLRLMHDTAREGVVPQRAFTLPAFDHQFVDVVRYTSPTEQLVLCHTVAGIDRNLPYGTYNVVITASGSNVRPAKEHFTIELIPLNLMFRKRDQ